MRNGGCGGILAGLAWPKVVCSGPMPWDFYSMAGKS